jgi:predicted ribosomally synthesized peptide with nif11-like leader
MSAEAVKTFFEKLDADEFLQRELAESADDAIRNVVREALIDMASKHGCEFTGEDLAQHLDSVSEELSDEDLERVAGGIIGDMGKPASFSRNVFQFLRPDRGAIGLVSNNPIPMPFPRWGGSGGEPT